MGEHDKTIKDRHYIHTEIQTLIQNIIPRNKAINLIMFSGELRVGAISILRVEDLEPIDMYNIYKDCTAPNSIHCFNQINRSCYRTKDY